MHWNSWSSCFKRSSQPCTSRFRASISTPGKPSVYLGKDAWHDNDDNSSHGFRKWGVTQFQQIIICPILYQMATCTNNNHVKCQDQGWKILWLPWGWTQIVAVSTAGTFSSTFGHRTAWWPGTPRGSCELKVGSEPSNVPNRSHAWSPWWYGNSHDKLRKSMRKLYLVGGFNCSENISQLGVLS